MQRRKGANFERLIANKLKALWPKAARGWRQTRHGSECADVEGTPWWLELQHANNPNPAAKYEQATEARDERPVAVVWRKTGSPKVKVTLALADLERIACARAEPVLVTLSFEDWVWLNRQAKK